MVKIIPPRQITVADMAPHIHSFKAGENKVNRIADWLVRWIQDSLKQGKIKEYDLLPSKGDLAFHIGVSKGTIQNAFRLIEDCGYLESKQRIGTYIRIPQKKNRIEKLTSKREFATEIIKKFIVDNEYQKGGRMPSTRKLSSLTGISGATIRLAFNRLVSEKILRKENNIFVVNRVNIEHLEIQQQTLVEKVAQNLKRYIFSNYKKGDKLPSNFELADRFSVSVKTIHDAVKLLSKEGIVHTRRGQYGTIVADSSGESVLYNYEKIELKIRDYITKNCDIGTKLPSIIEFSEQYQVSAKTIKKALDNLSEEGYVMFARGRCGGTFVTDIPQEINEAYKWLALSPEYMPDV